MFKAWNTNDGSESQVREYPSARNFDEAAELHALWMYNRTESDSVEISVTDGTQIVEFTVAADVEVSFSSFRHPPSPDQDGKRTR